MWTYTGQERPPFAETPGPGQESVWDYPRPPRLEPVSREIRVVLAGREVVRSRRAHRIVETAGAPVYYMPPEDVDESLLVAVSGNSYCEWKGQARYFDVRVGDRVAEHAAFTYPSPTNPDFAAIAGYYGFYAAPFDECCVGDARATPQPGGFYAGWVTPEIVGPIKGEPGTRHW